MRFRDWMSRENVGTDTIQTSGTASFTGAATFTQDYTYHSYQVVHTDGTPVSQFNLEVSNDNLNYTVIAAYDVGTSGLAYADTWNFTYARPTMTGTDGSFLINERHLQ